MNRTALALVGLLTASALSLSAEDWPQWRGTDRLAVWSESGIVTQLPEELKVTWRVPVRHGYAGPAVADGRVFVLDWLEDPESRTVDGTERLLALDEETGDVLWTHEWTTTYRMLMFSYAVGPRATPTVDDDRVYVVGACGRGRVPPMGRVASRPVLAAAFPDVYSLAMGVPVVSLR